MKTFAELQERVKKLNSLLEDPHHGSIFVVNDVRGAYAMDSCLLE